MKRQYNKKRVQCAVEKRQFHTAPPDEDDLSKQEQQKDKQITIKTKQQIFKIYIRR